MSDLINVMVNGLPGKMATAVAESILAAKKPSFSLIPFSFVGQSCNAESLQISGKEICPIKQPDRGGMMNFLKRDYEGGFIAVDYTRGIAGNGTAAVYCNNRIPFVMGTTGIDKFYIEQLVKESGNIAVVARNMAKPIVALQQFIENFSNQHAGQMASCTVEIKESHQGPDPNRPEFKEKKDTSGTAKDMVSYFQRLGMNIIEPDIVKIRDRDEQRALGVPEEHLDGHGWHGYHFRAPCNDSHGTLSLLKSELDTFFRTTPALRGYVMTLEHPYLSAKSVSGSLLLEAHDAGDDDLILRHNVNGRELYVEGTLAAIRFVHSMKEKGTKGKTFSMIDILEAGF